MRDLTTVKLAAFGAVLALGLGGTALAGENGHDVGTKFSRGLANTATGWVEVPKNIALESKRSNILGGITLGTIKGALHTVGRTTIGVVELGTFFIPNDDVVDSRYVWKDMDKETRYHL